MASTVFTDFSLPAISASWLNEVNRNVYTDRVNVKNFPFMAKGDGIQDDTVAVQLLSTMLASIGGGQGFFPQGTYKLTSTITLLTGVTFKGGDSLGEVSKYTKNPTFAMYMGQGSTTVAGFLLQASTGMAGFSFIYPNQSARVGTDLVPVQFGWTIATDLSVGTNLDSIYLENILLVNSYLGVNLDRAGRFFVKNLHGDCIKNGLAMDRVYDVPRMENVHFWPFWYTLDSNIGKWKLLNGRAFEIARVDGMNAFGLLALGYQDGIRFVQKNDGPGWATFTGCNFDGNMLPIGVERVNNVQFFGGSGTIYDVQNSIVKCFGDIDGSISFNGFKFYGLSNMGLVSTSSTGIIQLTGCIFPPNMESNVAGNGVRGVAVVNESTGILRIDGCELGNNKVYGGTSTFINGVPLLPQINQLTPTVDPNQASSWAGTLSGGQDGDGVKFNITSAVSLSDYSIPANLTAPGLQIVEFELQTPALSGMYLTVNLVANTGTGLFAPLYLSLVGMQNYDYVANDGTNRTKFICSYYSGQYIEQTVMRIEAHTYSSSVTTTLKIRGIKFYRPDPAIISNEQAQLIQNSGNGSQPVFSKNVQRNRYPNLTLSPIGGAVSYDGVGLGNQTLRGIAAPTIGFWRRGDTVINIYPVVGQPKGWICTVEGSPGTWVSLGNL